MVSTDKSKKNGFMFSVELSKVQPFRTGNKCGNRFSLVNPFCTVFGAIDSTSR